MICLALDTSTRMASVACGREGEVLAESQLVVKATHSESVLPEIDRLLRSCDMSPSDIGEVVVGAGPGSFTGVRIAASFAKGICFASGARLFAYSSLAAVARAVRQSGQVCAMFDARRGQVYAAGYSREAGLCEIFPPEAVSLPSLLARLEVPEWSFAGDGAAAGEDLISAGGGHVLDRKTWYPRASSLLRLRFEVPDAGLVAQVREWQPAYVRLPAAQRDLGS